MTYFTQNTAFRLSVAVNLLVLVVFINLSLYSRSVVEESPDNSLTNFYEDPKPAFPCDENPPRSRYSQRGGYWILYNYFKASRTFRCDESVTYSTHSDWTFLDNLVPLLERWGGPLSFAVYSPGTDFLKAFQRIQYLRECTSSTLVKELVTFHLFFDTAHVPNVTIASNPESISVNCRDLESQNMTFGEGLETYKKANKLLYPVNVARNVARETASTHYVFPSDIELYPNPGLIPEFLEMVRQNRTAAPKVFVLPIFEVEATVARLPVDKPELVAMLQNQSAVTFHKYTCPECHRVPKYKEWEDSPYEPGLRVFHVSKRDGKQYQFWEPIHIATKSDPEYDERLSWEGRKDKMTQAYLLCVLDYEFHILDNAFLVHRPGIKRPKAGQHNYDSEIAKQNQLIYDKIIPELTHIYGTRDTCLV